MGKIGKAVGAFAFVVGALTDNEEMMLAASEAPVDETLLDQAQDMYESGMECREDVMDEYDDHKTEKKCEKRLVNGSKPNKKAAQGAQKD